MFHFDWWLVWKYPHFTDLCVRRHFLIYATVNWETTYPLGHYVYQNPSKFDDRLRHGRFQDPLKIILQVFCQLVRWKKKRVGSAIFRKRPFQSPPFDSRSLWRRPHKVAEDILEKRPWRLSRRLAFSCVLPSGVCVRLLNRGYSKYRRKGLVGSFWWLVVQETDLSFRLA